MTEEDLVGKVIEQYTLLRCIGEGSFSEVYEAQCKNKFFACKVCEQEKQYNTELAAYTLLKNSGASLAIHSTGEYQGHKFIVMDLGTDARNLIFRGNIGKNLVAFLQVLDCVKICTEKGVNHNDIRESNIVFYEEQAKLIDFGTASFSSIGLSSSYSRKINPCLGTEGFNTRAYRDTENLARILAYFVRNSVQSSAQIKARLQAMAIDAQIQCRKAGTAQNTLNLLHSKLEEMLGLATYEPIKL